MARFNFTNITMQSRASIDDVMGNFNKIESNAALLSDLTSAVNTLNTTINNKETALKAVATTSANGMMSSTDKSKLDGIAANANNYSLPTAATNSLGGVKTTSTTSSTSGLTACPIIAGVVYYKDTNTTYNAATTSANGLMSKEDKAKLDGIAAGATANTATATTSANGLMSSTDKSKLDGIAANANNYSLPTASSTLGGVKTTSTVTSNSGYTACPIISGVPYYKDTNTTYSVATTSANGLMSSTDKSKLDGIASNANNYSLPTASTTLGGVKTTSNVSDVSTYTACPIVGGVPYYKDTNTTYNNATTSTAGLMSSADKTKLNGIAENANNYSLPTGAKDVLGGVKTTSTVSSNSGYTACPIISGVVYYKDTNTTYDNATTSTAGLMSATDKTKLDGIATGATKVTVENVLTSDSTTNALSAAQGKSLKTSVDGKAPTSHASTATTYGIGTTTKYGHCMTINNLTTSSHADGKALSAYQGYVLNTAINGKQKSISVGDTTPTGGSNGDIYLQYFA